MITNDTSDLGPLVNLDGQLVHRDLLDLSTLKAPDYTGFGKIEPRLSTVLPFRYMLASGVLTSQYMTSEFDFLKSMRLAVVGDEDHISTTSELDADLLSEFVHPETGETYQAVQIGEFPVSYNLVEKLNVFKERYARLNACVTDPVVRDADSFCACASSTKTNLLGDSGCGEPNLSKVGENQCSLDDLEKRRDIAHEQMGQLVGYLNDMRWMSSALTN